MSSDAKVGALARKRALILTAVSLAGFLAWNQLRTFKHPWGDLSSGNYTDHLSHMNAARAFPSVGLDIWRKPALELTRPATPAERAAWPADVHPGGKWTGGTYAFEGWPAAKPWVTSWAQIPRLYPPGDMLLVAPVAAAYHFTGLSLTEANRWLFALLLLYAHLAIFLVWEGALAVSPRKAPLLYAGAIASSIFFVVWSLQGFYDAAAVAPLVLCARFLDGRRALAAAVAFAVAAFIHFRAYFFAPWFVWAAVLFVRDGQWRRLQARDAAALAVGLCCAAASLGVFALVSPALAAQHVNNSLNLSLASAGALLPFAAVVLAAGVALRFAGAWLDLAMLAWITLMMLFVKEAHEWHIVVPLAWLAAPAPGDRPELVRAARLLMLAYLAARVMVN